MLSIDFDNQKVTEFDYISLGYGSTTPKTVNGKIATMVYAIIGIPISISMYTSASDLVTAAIRNSLRYIEIKCFKKDQVKFLHTKTVCISFTLLLIFFFSLAYSNTLEGHGNLTMIDSTYYWFQTLTTIGYGDVYPVAEHNDVMETFLRISCVFGLGMTASMISSISTLMHEINKERVTKYFSFSRKSWTLRQE